jgi:hypothetical protein
VSCQPADKRKGGSNILAAVHFLKPIVSLPPGFLVACYARDLESFMARGRELRKQGIKDQRCLINGKKK